MRTRTRPVSQSLDYPVASHGLWEKESKLCPRLFWQLVDFSNSVLLGWPKGSFGFPHTIIQANPNKLFLFEPLLQAPLPQSRPHDLPATPVSSTTGLCPALLSALGTTLPTCSP